MPYSPEAVQPLEAYASATSVIAGGAIDFHVSVKTPVGGRVSMSIYRSSQLGYSDSQFGVQADSVYKSDYRPHIGVKPGESPLFEASFDPVTHPTPVDASRNGCEWPAAVAWKVPELLPSSVYVARFAYGDDTTYALFVVRPRNPGPSRIVCQLSFSTYQAYNCWGGFSFYGPPISPDFSAQLSFDRPCQFWDYILYDQPIATWLERNYDVDFCTNIDLHTDETLLQPYQLFVSCGHDEYWSAVMRDRIEAFAAAGGNVMFLSGNTCYRPVGFDGRCMTVQSTSWQEVGRPEASTTGLNFCAGHWSSPLPAKGYTVQVPSHWMFDGTGLEQGDLLGESEGIMGYETDAAVCDDHGNPIAPTPGDFITVADANLDEWRDFVGRRATMGMYRKNGRGVVMAAGTTGWGQGLRSDGGDVHRVTSNLVNCLRHRFDEGDLVLYRDANRDGTGDVGGGEIVWRGGWSEFARVFDGGDGVFYSVTESGDLLWHGNDDDIRDVTKGKVIGHGGWNDFTSLFSGGDGVIYGVTEDGNLVWHKDENRDGTGSVAAGQVIGHGGWNDYACVFSGGDGLVYAVTRDGDLLWHQDETRDGTGDISQGHVIGHGGWSDFAHVFCGGDGIIYAVTQDGDLLWYKDHNRDGTGDVSNGQTIGHGGWSKFAMVFAGDEGAIYAITPASA